MKKLFLRDGKLWYNEFPEEPVPYGVGDEQYYGARMDEYNAAISAAKASAVEVVNPEELFIRGDDKKWYEVIGRNGPDYVELLPDTLRIIPKGWVVEISSCHSATEGFYRSAHLIPLKEQSSGIAAVGVAEYGELETVMPSITIRHDGPHKPFRPLAGMPESGENRIIDAMFNAQFGSKEQCSAIEEHMKEYFQRWPSYKDRLNHLEWYHLFLDFSDFLEKRKSVSPPPQAESDEDLWAELGNKINKHMEPLDDAFGIHPLLDLYGKSEFTITRKAKP